ncbi:hypothetical protein [Conexibacter woesei]|uniref:Uncharacterized protein n=1 Tax=Conexibacter woesei (strain DSM 14684 / CCUG 47730 / CIP 108061 / JCM 11494 / NBRC 100937 / ID131577) TaxID=469383 RepID=D3F0E5_CONWI|nr:hypothetical protein [Conexibacter woesei]ADB52005.1 hypothetical protein Cwoe_3587 [Conexibacter woesei DSM 14684]
MGFDLSRLRRGEWVAAGGALVLFVTLFFFKWYGAGVSFEGFSFEASANGWHTHSILRWFMLLTIVAVLALVVTTATQATTALPVTAAVLATAIALLTTVLLAYRVLIDEPGPNEFISVKFGAYLGLVASAVIVYGGYLSMRDESTGTPAPEVPARRVGAAEPSGDAPPAA